jgi:hypothetical protein
MPEPDYDWINQQLDLFIKQTIPHNLSGNGFITSQNGPAAPVEDVIAQAEVVEPILDKFYPEWRTAIATSNTYKVAAASRGGAALPCTLGPARRGPPEAR